MKKTLWLALVLLLVCVFVFSACDNGDSPSNDTTGNNQQTTEENKESSNSTDPIVCEHTFGDWNTVKQATCKEEGKLVRTCNKCSKTEESTMAKTDVHTEVVYYVSNVCIYD